MKFASEPWTPTYTPIGETSMYVPGVYASMKRSPYHTFYERWWLTTYTPALRVHGVWYVWPRIAGGHTCIASLSLKLQNASPARWLARTLNQLFPQSNLILTYRALNQIKKFELILEVQFLMKRVTKFFLAAIGRFSKYPTACIYDKSNGPSVLKFLDLYIESHGITWPIRLNQAKCLVGNQVKTLCNKKIST